MAARAAVVDRDAGRERLWYRSKENLQHQDLLSLFRGDAALIVVPGFASAEWIAASIDRIRATPAGSFNGGEQFKRIGEAFVEVDSEARRDAYHANALAHIAQVRQLFRPYPSPIDELRALVEECWPAGANLLRIDGRPFAAGICRVQQPGVDLEPHTDRLERNLGGRSDFALTGQLSCNVYLRVPRQGGELEIWNHRPREDEYTALRGDRTYGIDRDRLPPADIVVKPAAGDLFILNPRFIHAVRPVEDEPRVTLGLFLGKTDSVAPLAYWS